MRSSPRVFSAVALRTLRACCLVACAALAAPAFAQTPGERAVTAGEEPQAALAVPELSPPPDFSALAGKPVRRVEVVPTGTRFKATARVES
ncbi:MAG TPA: hypothetical protein PK156_21530, partial [Polyangium sp.]|nr:hypothetical protein [Polyangium sp.]